MLLTILFRALGLGAIGFALWFMGPAIEYNGQYYLADEQIRYMVLGGLGGLWLLSSVWTWFRVRQTNAKMLQDLADDASEQIDEEAKVIGERFEKALDVLKTSVDGKAFVHQLPWYIIIGPPGSGKTTALVNSGLHFPMKDHLGSEVIQGIGGTRNCDWWFTTDAVLIDTAGRYTTQDSHEEVDKAAWQNFMGLLKRFRPERPINGVVIAVSLADLMEQSEAERVTTAQAIRARISELSENLNVRFPVYFMFTKCDLVAGFMEFFDKLNPNHRNQVWGETFEMTDHGDCALDVTDYGGNFDGLIKLLNNQLLHRMHEDTDADNSLEMLGFPTQMASLKYPIVHMLSEIFDSSFGRGAAPLLRGVYYTSGTQAGTPIDRLLGSMASNLGIDNADKIQYGGRGKSFFIKDLLKEVMFPEANMAGVNRALLRRRNFMKLTSFAVSAAVIAAAVTGWLLSNNANSLMVSRVGELADIATKVGYNDLLEGADVTVILEELNLVEESTKIFEEPQLTDRLGLYQGTALQPAAQEAYGALLEKKLLPVAVARLEEDMIAAINTGDTSVINGLLKAYLMWGGISENAGVDIDTALLRSTAKAQWQSEFSDDPELVTSILAHLDNLFAQGFTPITLDRSIVKEARGKLLALPVNEQIYQNLRQNMLQDSSGDLQLSSLGGGKFASVFKARSGRSITELKVPEMYTKDGFYNKVVPALQNASQSFQGDAWVLGNHNSTDSGPGLNTTEIYNSYYKDYAKQWNDLLLDLEVRPDGNNQQLVTRIEDAMRPGGIVETLLTTIAQQTWLPKPELVGQTPADGDWTRDQVADPLARRFNSFHDIQSDRATLDAALTAGAELAVFLDQTLLNALSTTPALNAVQRRVAGGSRDVFGMFRSQIRRLPTMVRTWSDGLYEEAWKKVMQQARKEIDDEWKQELVGYYSNFLVRRYPFNPKAEEDANLRNFAELFGPKGKLSAFIDSRLVLFVDTDGTEWREKPVDGVTLGLSQSSLEQLKQVRDISRLFFSRTTGQPEITFTFRPIRLSDTAASVDLTVSGQTISYTYGDKPPVIINWPPQIGNEESKLSFETLLGSSESQSAFGAWSMFKLLDQFGTKVSSSGSTFEISLELEGMQVDLEIKSQGTINVLSEPVLQDLTFPAGL